MMIRYTQSEVTDDSLYLDWVEATMAGVDETIKTDKTFVVKIDNWLTCQRQTDTGPGT